MTKEELDKIIEIVSNIDSFEKILEACKICKDEQLINNMQNALETGEEQVLIEAVEQLRDTIHSQIPSELQEYYYIQTIDRGAANILLDDEQRKKAEELYDQKIEEIISLDEDERIKASREIHMQESKLRVLRSLSDAKKLEVLDELDENTRYSVILEMTDDYVLLEAFDKIGDELKPSIVEKIKSSEIKLQLLDKLEIGRLEILQTIDNPEVQLQALDKLSESEKAYFAIHTDNIDVKIKALEQLEEQDKAKVVKSISNPKQRFQMLDQLQGSSKLEVALSLGDPILMLQARDMFADEEKGKITAAIKEIVISQKPEDSILRRLYDKNNDLLEQIDYRLLDKKYLDTLGEEKINLISCYSDIQDIVLNLPQKEYDIFVKCIDEYISKTETDEWTQVAKYLLENLKKGEYTNLIESIEDVEKVDIGKLSKILQLPNTFDIKTIKDLEDYEEIKRKKCDEIINSKGNIEEKKKAVLLKLFGQDMEYAKTIIDKYGEDIISIDDGEEKDFVIALKEIMDIEDQEILMQIYNECEGVGLVDKTLVERNLKTAYGKKFNDGLYETKFEDIIEDDLPEELKGLNVYDAGIDFKMIITSIAAYIESKPQNFEKDWNRPAIGSQHFCASYIRNDMLGTPPVRHLCYGFTQMKEDSLMLSGPKNIFSSEKGVFVSEARADERYYSPDKQINETIMHNEMDFRRTQGGTKKQPDYIVAFKRNGKIDNIEEILQATKDWGGELPIVIVDVDRCLAAERGKVDDMLMQYSSKKTPQLAREILQKVRNNRVTDKSFGEDIQLGDIEKWLKEHGAEEELTNGTSTETGKVSIADMVDNNKMVSAQERKEGISAMRKLRDRLQEMTSKREGEDIEQ